MKPTPEPTIRGGRARELHSIGVERDGRADILVLPDPQSQKPPTWIYAALLPEPVGSLFLGFRFDRPRPLRARLYAFGLWATLTHPSIRPVWLRYRGDIDTHPIAPGSHVRLWGFTGGLVEIAPPGRVERVSI